MTRRTRVTIAVAAAAVLAVTVAAVLVLRGDDPATLPVRAAGGPTADRGADAEASSPAAAVLPFPGSEVEWKLPDDLPELDGEAPAYRLGAASDEAVAAMAAALGLEGVPERAEGSWLVTDGPAVLQVFDGPGSPWSYSPEGGGGVAGSTGSGEGTSGSDSGTEVVEPPTETTVPDVRAGGEPAEPARPADLPTEDEAKAIALDLVAATGLDVEAAAVAADDLVTEWSVRVDPAVDGLPTYGMTTYVAVGAGGAVGYGNGYLGTPERADTYPLVGTSAAADRLGQGLPGAPGILGGDTAVSSDEATVSVEACDPALGPDGDPNTRDACPRDGSAGTEPGAAPDCDPNSDSGGCVGIDPPEQTACDPALGPDGDAATEDACPPVTITPVPPHPVPCDPATSGEAGADTSCPPAEPVVVEVTGVRLGLALVGSADGSGSWLLPAYLWDTRWPGSDQPSVDVTLAVDDAFLLPAEGTTGD